MKPPLHRLCLLVLFLLLSISISLATPEAKTYLDEFSEPGETCEIVDYFVYQVLTPRFYDGNHHDTTVPVYYLCSKENASTLIIYDLYNSKFSDKKYLPELIDLNYIKNNLQTKQLSEQYFITKGVDVCNYFGGEKLTQESVNLATDVAEYSTVVMPPKVATDVNTAIKISRNLNLASKFNPINAITSVGCKYKNDQVKLAVETLATCNGYLSNIRNNYARTGYVDQLGSCVQNAQTLLDAYIKSTSAQLFDIANRAGGVIDALVIKPLINMFTGFSTGNYEMQDMSIEKTELDIAKEISSALSNSVVFFHNPDRNQVVEKHIQRIDLKIGEWELKYAEVVSKKYQTEDITRSRIGVLFSDVFYEPNYNLSEGRDSLSLATSRIKEGETYFSQNRFNSAINDLSLAEESLANSISIMQRENAIQRVFDKRWIYIPITILVLIGLGGFGIYYYYKKYFNNNPQSNI